MHTLKQRASVSVQNVLVMPHCPGFPCLIPSGQDCGPDHYRDLLADQKLGARAAAYVLSQRHELIRHLKPRDDALNPRFFNQCESRLRIVAIHHGAFQLQIGWDVFARARHERRQWRPAREFSVGRLPVKWQRHELTAGYPRD